MQLRKSSRDWDALSPKQVSGVWKWQKGVEALKLGRFCLGGSTSQTRQVSTWATPCQRASEQPTLFPVQDDKTWKPLENWCDQLFSSVVPMLLRDNEEEPEGRQLFDLDSFLSDISDTLFTMTQAPCPPQLMAEEGKFPGATAGYLLPFRARLEVLFNSTFCCNPGASGKLMVSGQEASPIPHPQNRMLCGQRRLQHPVAMSLTGK